MSDAHRATPSTGGRRVRHVRMRDDLTFMSAPTTKPTAGGQVPGYDLLLHKGRNRIIVTITAQGRWPRTVHLHHPIEDNEAWVPVVSDLYSPALRAAFRTRRAPQVTASAQAAVAAVFTAAYQGACEQPDTVLPDLLPPAAARTHREVRAAAVGLTDETVTAWQHGVRRGYRCDQRSLGGHFGELTVPTHSVAALIDAGFTPEDTCRWFDGLTLLRSDTSHIAPVARFARAHWPQRHYLALLRTPTGQRNRAPDPVWAALPPETALGAARAGLTAREARAQVNRARSGSALDALEAQWAAMAALRTAAAA